MFAIAYVLGMVALGDRVTTRFFPTWSLAHRAAGAFLVGLLLSTWITYLAAAIVAGLERPLLVGNVIFAAVVIFALRDLPRRVVAGLRGGGIHRLRSALVGQWAELAGLGLLIVLAAWLAVATFAVNETELLIGNVVYSDFGPTTAIAQSFAVGNNFPTVYPHFAGEPIRYHFLFYFQAGNLTFLGLDPALSLNLLSVLSLAALLALVVTLGRLVFRSATVGWLGAALFFFHGSLAWLPYFASLPSVTTAIDAIAGRREFLPSGFPYRGEDWGVWSMVIFANQRHFASGIGILLLVLIFLLGRWRLQRSAHDWLAGVRELRDLGRSGLRSITARAADLRGRTVARFVFAGLLLGALPMWNGAVFVAAAVVLAVLFVLMPDRHYLLFLAAAAAITALPQLEFLRPSAGVNAPYPALSWGYVIDDPAPLNVAGYFAFTFGPKLVLALAALSLVRVLERKLFLAAAALVVLTLTVQFSAEALVNHKFLNIWLVLLNLFAAYALVALWRSRPVANLMLGRLLAAVLVLVIAVGGVIDLMPFRNGHMIGVPYRQDPLAEWVAGNTEPRDVFLTDILVTSPILTRGRSIFLGWTYYAWSAGYDMEQREATYRHLYAESDPQLLAHMLRANDIAYVVFDDQVRTRGFVEHPNEQVYRDNFVVAFEDAAYGNIRIYAVP